MLSELALSWPCGLCWSSPSPPSIRSHSLRLLLLDLPVISAWVLATSTLGPIRSAVTSLLLLQMKITYQLSRAMLGFYGSSDGKESACKGRSLRCRRPGFDPWVRRIPWRREWLPTPWVFLPGESQGQRRLPGHSPCGQKEPYATVGLTASRFSSDVS